jgi:hypothetical protein
VRVNWNCDGVGGVDGVARIAEMTCTRLKGAGDGGLGGGHGGVLPAGAEWAVDVAQDSGGSGWLARRRFEVSTVGDGHLPMSSCASVRARLRDRAICLGSVESLFNFAWCELSRVGARDGSCWDIDGGVPCGRGRARGVGGSAMEAVGVMLVWVANLRRFRHAARAGVRRFALNESSLADRARSS